MNICMVGYGSIAGLHARALKQEKVALHTVVGRLAEATADFAQEHGFRRHTTDIDTALADADIDAVLITSPTDLHFEHAGKALRAGKHVLVEIPLATSLAEVDELVGLAAAADRHLMVCHTQRYLPAFTKVRQVIADGQLHVHHIIYRYGFLRRENVNWLGRQRSWTDNLLWHHACHTVDTSLWLLGAREADVQGHVALPSKPLGIPLDLDIALRTPGDQLISIAMSYNTHVRINDCLIIGEEDTLLVAGERLSNKDGVLHEPSPEGDQFTIALPNQDREFLAAVEEGRQPAVDGAAVRPTMAVLQAVQDRFEATSPPGKLHAIG